ncbi:Pilus assembly protein FimT [Pseudomonas sp. 8Z]|uniref:GspH/FimT family pseudopilin n=1 Tax=Pseudomonas sp. 8Z TaxID=2653166 RepID=UPI0012EF561E|nr:GspH/FimT family pseudopilin [Pseudomonas sp. 8Z]VXD02541.1 Pilus assembly protein FimT [Pseudomonas sp. 8Z]
MSGKKQALGFTLVELMIVLVLLAIVAFIAVPNFTDLIERNRTQAQAEELKGFLLFARGEAVSRSTSITVTQNDNDEWVAKRGDEELRQLAQNPEQAQIEASVDEIRFRSNGTATAASFTVCQNDEAAKGYRLEVQASGAISLFPQGRTDNENTEMTSCTP